MDKCPHPSGSEEYYAWWGARFQIGFFDALARIDAQHNAEKALKRINHGHNFDNAHRRCDCGVTRTQYEDNPKTLCPKVQQ